MLDINPEGVRSTGAAVRGSAESLGTGVLGPDVPPFGSDEVSAAIVANLNGRRRWLELHVASGHGQALAGAEGIESSAAGYESQDQSGASAFGGPGASPTAAAITPVPGAPSAPAGRPSAGEIPDISGTEGEALALALAAGTGTGPALAAAARCAALAAQAQAAAVFLSTASATLVASGESEMHAPLLKRLGDALSWSEGIFVESTALAVGYSTAASTHTATTMAVGTPAVWRTMKTALNEAVVENQLTMGAAEPRVQALRRQLTTMQQDAGIVMVNYQVVGQQVSDSPAPTSMPEPKLAPGSESPVAPAVVPPVGEDADLPEEPGIGSTDGVGGGDLFGPLAGVLGQITKGLGQGNPLSSVGQVASQVGEQVGKAVLGAGQSGAGLKSAGFAPAKAAVGSGGLGKGVGGGGVGIGAGAAMHPAAAVPSAPAVSSGGGPAVAPVKAAAGAGVGAGMGMMPMGARGGDRSSKAIDAYPDPLTDVPGTGRPGTVGDSSAPASVLKPESHKDIRKRIAARRVNSGLEEKTD